MNSGKLHPCHACTLVGSYLPLSPYFQSSLTRLPHSPQLYPTLTEYSRLTCTHETLTYPSIYSLLLPFFYFIYFAPIAQNKLTHIHLYTCTSLCLYVQYTRTVLPCVCKKLNIFLKKKRRKRNGENNRKPTVHMISLEKTRSQFMLQPLLLFLHFFFFVCLFTKLFFSSCFHPSFLYIYLNGISLFYFFFRKV